MTRWTKTTYEVRGRLNAYSSDFVSAHSTLDEALTARAKLGPGYFIERTTTTTEVEIVE